MVFMYQNDTTKLAKHGFSVGVLRRFVVLMTMKSCLREQCAHGVLELNGVTLYDWDDFSLNERAHGGRVTASFRCPTVLARELSKSQILILLPSAWAWVNCGCQAVPTLLGQGFWSAA